MHSSKHDYTSIIYGSRQNDREPWSRIKVQCKLLRIDYIAVGSYHSFRIVCCDISSILPENCSHGGELKDPRMHICIFRMLHRIVSTNHLLTFRERRWHHETSIYILNITIFFTHHVLAPLRCCFNREPLSRLRLQRHKL